ncbi:nucleoside triphosphate pyrophosphohydrolase [Breoghania sp. L-A4]|uniref:nucleoside triphosphate pyrophosphohydrolase n=1 Tax=Breoghania sp. L-A4 TaxID=2304600 RepID=UPI000E36057F|nr:nucleoside triphosphate pyrophosphohydrolase [Breoghania sp. L-A4]AXS40662.1 nucleoside triphosphate pyrophosphohydrolase [Breoghania sp. L-A4]
MQPSRDISRLIEIMAALREPATGCPWDVEQTFESIAPYTIEEAYEVADAIHRGDSDDLCEELGDLLLQVVYHARMAEELEQFAFGDVVQAVTKKMIRRHPHVFGDAEARDAGMAKGQWDAIKREEKRERAERRVAQGKDAEARRGLLDAVPVTLPALTTAEKLQKQAAHVGFDWGKAGPVIAKIREELDELEAEIEEAGPDTTPEMEDELGDVLFAMANLARHLEIDPEKALGRTNRKFRRRFAHIETRARADDRGLEAMSLDDMEALWQEAKRIERGGDAPAAVSTSDT